jgi:hypothetical protein
MLLGVIIMIYNVLWGFSIDPPYFGYNPVEQENLFCVFLSFRNLPELKLTWEFWSINILPRETLGDQEFNERRPKGQTRPGGAGPWPGRAS